MRPTAPILLDTATTDSLKLRCTRSMSIMLLQFSNSCDIPTIFSGVMQTIYNDEFMNVHPLFNVLDKCFISIAYDLGFKDVAALERTCTQIRTQIRIKKNGKKIYEQYGQCLKGANIKFYLRDYTASDPIALGKKNSGFYGDLLSNLEEFLPKNTLTYPNSIVKDTSTHENENYQELQVVDLETKQEPLTNLLISESS